MVKAVVPTTLRFNRIWRFAFCLWLAALPGFPSVCLSQEPQAMPPAEAAENALAGSRTSQKKNEKDLKPVPGYRFILAGDFDGDGQPETLTEHYLDGRTRKESPKYYEDIEYDELVELAVQKEPISLMICDNPKIKPLVIQKGGQLLGLAYAKNEGDLDGDGRDELSYVINAADWSAINRCIVAGYRNGRWKRLVSFSIHESWLPELPDDQTQFWLFGVAGAARSAGNKAEYRRVERKMKAFKGLIRKLGLGKIRVHTYLRSGNDGMKTLTLK